MILTGSAKIVNNEKIFVVSNRVVHRNSKIDWPDMNYPNSGMTILRVVHELDYQNNQVQLDGAKGPWFSSNNLPEGVGFYKKCQ